MTKDKEKSLNDIFSNIGKWFKEKPNTAYYLLLGLIVISGVYIRLTNIPHLFDQLAGLDPYIFYRYSQEIVETGRLAHNDTMRYYPEGFDTRKEGTIHSYLLAYAFKLLNPLSGVSLMRLFQVYPAIFAGLAFIMFFLFVDEVFENKKIAAIATAFLAVVPAFLFRTSAGFADKEPIAIFLIFSTLYFFVKAIKEKSKKAYVYGVLSGLANGLCGLSWGGIIFVFEAISLYMFIEILLDRIDKRKYFVYVSWIMTLLPFFVVVSHRYGHWNFYKNMMLQPPLLALGLGALYLLLSKYIKRIKPIKKIPDGLFFLIFFAVLFIAGDLLIGTGITKKLYVWITNNIITPGALGDSIVAKTVAENQPPYFYGGMSNWWGNFSFLIIFFFGGIFLFSHMLFEKFDRRLVISIISFVFFVIFIMSRFSPSAEFEFLNRLFSSTYIFLLYIFLVSLFVFYFIEWDKKHIKDLDEGYIIMFIYVLLTVIAARGAVRNLFSVAPGLCAISGLFIIKSYDEIKRLTKERIYAIPVIIIAIIFVSYFGYSSYRTVKDSFWTSIVDGWIPAFEWIKTQTPGDSVFIHWWDYGYWIQTLGERSTVLDGGNYRSPYRAATEFFTSSNSTETLGLLEDYGRPTHLLIVDDDISKFYQIQRIAGRNIWFSTFYFNQQTRIDIDGYTQGITLNSISGASPTFEDMRIGNFLWSKDETYAVQMVAPISNDSLIWENTYVLLTNQRFGNTLLKMGCLCLRGVGCQEIPGGEFPACVVPIEQGALFVPYGNLNMLFTRLYVLNMSVPGFEIAYDNGIPFNVQGIASQSQTHAQIWAIDYDKIEGAT